MLHSNPKEQLERSVPPIYIIESSYKLSYWYFNLEAHFSNLFNRLTKVSKNCLEVREKELLKVWMIWTNDARNTKLMVANLQNGDVSSQSERTPQATKQSWKTQMF